MYKSALVILTEESEITLLHSHKCIIETERERVGKRKKGCGRSLSLAPINASVREW